MALLLITHDLGVAAKLCTDMRVMYAGRIVEATHAAQLYLSPTHPYTEALLRSTVRTDVDVANSIGAIPGQPPQLWQLPSGCSFHPRCPYAVDLCRTTVPPPTYLGDPEEVVAECHFARDRFRPLLAGRAEIASMSISAYRSPSQRAAPARNGPLVEARDLVKEYGHHGRGGNASRLRAVDGVSFAISAGESFGLVGESGSGKSTLALLLLALERPTSGKAIFAGRPLQAISAKDLHQLRRKMQIVFQDPVGSLNRRKTVEEIIEAPLVVHGIGPASLRRVRVSELLELVGLHPRHAKSYPRELSGGQAQRVGIARALALKPEFVIFDEAVSSLDASIRAQILNLVRNLQTELGLTYLFISHDLAIVRYMSTRVAVMYRGRIVEVGERTQLFTDPRHPYTHELLRAIPQPHYSSPSAGRLTTKLEADGGDLPSGCRFRRRCPIGKSEEVCERLDPPLRPIGSNHWVACHFAETAPQLLSETRAASVSPGEEDTDA